MPVKTLLALIHFGCGARGTGEDFQGKHLHLRYYSPDVKNDGARKYGFVGKLILNQALGTREEEK